MSLRRPDAVTLAVLAVTALALALRLTDLGARAMHHDESLHAVFAWHLAEGRGYVHDPLMHGPLQFHLIAGLFRLFGDGEVMARLPAALAGTALVAVPLLLRRWLGGAGTVAAAVLLALSRRCSTSRASPATTCRPRSGRCCWWSRCGAIGRTAARAGWRCWRRRSRSPSSPRRRRTWRRRCCCSTWTSCWR